MLVLTKWTKMSIYSSNSGITLVLGRVFLFSSQQVGFFSGKNTSFATALLFLLTTSTINTSTFNC